MYLFELAEFIGILLDANLAVFELIVKKHYLLAHFSIKQILWHRSSTINQPEIFCGKLAIVVVKLGRKQINTFLILSLVNASTLILYIKLFLIFIELTVVLLDKSAEILRRTDYLRISGGGIFQHVSLQLLPLLQCFYNAPYFLLVAFKSRPVLFVSFALCLHGSAYKFFCYVVLDVSLAH